MTLEIANRLIQMRKARGLSQESLAETIGVSRQAVSKWERAEASPDTDNLIMLARLYGVSIDELLGHKPTVTLESSEVDAEIHDDSYDAGQIEVITNNCDESSNRFDRRHERIQLLKRIPFVLVVLIAFFLLGSVWGLWHPAWLLFMLIPVYASLVSAIEKRSPIKFCYPVLAAFIYLLLGFYCGWWHPGWIIFLTIPVYYCVVPDKAEFEGNVRINLGDDDDESSEVFDDCLGS